MGSNPTAATNIFRFSILQYILFFEVVGSNPNVGMKLKDVVFFSFAWPND